MVLRSTARIAQIGSPLELYNRAATDLFVAGFIGSPQMNFLAGTIAAADGGGLAVTVDGGRATLPLGPRGDAARVGSPCTIGIRPEHLDPTPDGSLAVKLTSREFVGSETIVAGTLESGETVTCSLRGFHRVAPGEILRASIEPRQVYVFDEASAALR